LLVFSSFCSGSGIPAAEKEKMNTYMPKFSSHDAAQDPQ
jgi:hypothetical protein